MEATKIDDSKAFTAPETKLHFLDYWRIIRIRKTVILTVFLLVALTTTVVTFLLPESFSSTAKIAIEQDMPDVDSSGGGIAIRPTPDPFFLQTEFERIQSKKVLYRVIEELDLQRQWGVKYKKQPGATISREQAYGFLKNSIAVEPFRNTTMVEIRAFSDNKDEASTIANKVAEVYKEVRGLTRAELIKGGLKALKDQLAVKEADVSNQLQVVNHLRATNQISDFDANANQPSQTLDQETYRQLNNSLREAKGNLAVASSVYGKLASLSREKLKEVAPMQVPNDSRLSDLINKENDTVQRLAVLLGRLDENHPDVLSTRKLLSAITNQLNDTLSGLTNSLETRVQTERITVETYTKELEEARAKDQTNYAKLRPYYEAKEELAKLKFARDKLALNIDAKEVEFNTPTKGTVAVIEEAEPNPNPVRPNKKLNIGLGLGIGLLIGIGLAFFIEYLDTSVKTIDDVERALQAPVLGVIPQNVGLLVDEGPESPHAEAYRVLRTNVLFSRKDPKLNTLTVVSGGAGEGKSTTIFNLATVFAQNGQRVLVVDSDLRRPSLHKYLRISNSIGLTNYLLKQNTLEEVIQTSTHQNLDFLPSGRLPSSSLGILSSMQMKELIRDVKRRYDFVFFDSPPIMGVSDASILASEVDMVLQVIQYRRYPQPMTIRAKQMIEKVGGNLLGIVLNNINVSQDENYYYYSGYYYDYYSKGEYADREKKEAAAVAGKDPKVEIKSKF
ncbi:MAG TPA: polysaccharide biosynthesis tyrosine autokinase [Verrucomicrobiae bacterium]|jgi:capsular exopolysaccharide synthesis family protein